MIAGLYHVILHKDMGVRIVITGAPSSGKTEFFARLKLNPAFKDFVFFDELARQLLMENPSFRDDPSGFHREIYSRQVAREDLVAGKPFITDRGTIDAFAFHPETLGVVQTTLETEYARYDAVIQLSSAASLEGNLYKYDNIRRESPADAMIIERALKNVWKGHPGYCLICAELDFERKYSHFLDAILRVIRA